MSRVEAGVRGNRNNERNLVGMGPLLAIESITAPSTQGYQNGTPNFGNYSCSNNGDQ